MLPHMSPTLPLPAATQPGTSCIRPALAHLKPPPAGPRQHLPFTACLHPNLWQPACRRCIPSKTAPGLFIHHQMTLSRWALCRTRYCLTSKQAAVLEMGYIQLRVIPRHMMLPYGVITGRLGPPMQRRINQFHRTARRNHLQLQLFHNRLH
jgi:hypothetical protein